MGWLVPKLARLQRFAPRSGRVKMRGVSARRRRDAGVHSRHDQRRKCRANDQFSSSQKSQVFDVVTADFFQLGSHAVGWRCDQCEGAGGAARVEMLLKLHVLLRLCFLAPFSRRNHSHAKPMTSRRHMPEKCRPLGQIAPGSCLFRALRRAGYAASILSRSSHRERQRLLPLKLRHASHTRRAGFRSGAPAWYAESMRALRRWPTNPFESSAARRRNSSATCTIATEAASNCARRSPESPGRSSTRSTATTARA